MGFAFDGDGDRLGLIDNKGNVIWADRQMILYARDILSRNQGAKIVFDVKCSSNLPKDITQHGGNAIMSRTGHSFIKAKLKETGALLGGEMSGHIFFKERWYGFDDALYTGARLLESAQITLPLLSIKPSLSPSPSKAKPMSALVSLTA
jgi:phosphomannomutase/phosphoglucomutase